MSREENIFGRRLSPVVHQAHGFVEQWTPEAPEEWMDDALCAQTDPEAFFPERGGSSLSAKRICTSCDVREKCLEYALRRDEQYGIYGGLSPKERRRVKRERRDAA